MVGALGIGVAIRQGVEVVGGRRDLDVLHQAFNFAVARVGVFLFVADIGLVYQPLDIRARNQRFGQHLHLLVNIGLKCQARHQWLQHGLRVHEHLGAGLIAVGHQRDADGRHNGHWPGYRQGKPTPQPDCEGNLADFLDDFVHA